VTPQVELLESGDGVSPWEPERSVPTFGLQEIRFGRGFLRADYLKIFSGLRAMWVPIFTANEVKFSITRVDADFQFPGELEHLFVAKADGETALIGIDRSSFETIGELFVNSTDRFGGSVLVDYLARRLLLTLARSWNASSAPSELVFFGEADIGEVEIEGHLAIQCHTAAGDLSVHLGLGPELLQKLDLLAREQLTSSMNPSTRGRKHQLVIELGALDPAALRGSLEPGALIRTTLPHDSAVAIRFPDGTAMSGVLGQFNGRFAVQSLGEPVQRNEKAVVLELARGEITEEDLGLLRQPGAIFLSKTIVSGGASMMQADRLIARTSLGVLDENLVIAIEEQ